MNQYIITEELLQKWKELDYSAKDIYNEARSHPYQSERDTISKELALELCMDARKDATEKVLDDLDKRAIYEAKTRSIKEGGLAFVSVQVWIEELRQSERVYQCGDECKGECSGEVDGILHCPVSDSITSMDADCNVTYADGRTEPCKYQPRFTFAECEPGYGSHGDCPKWDYYNQQNKVGRDTTNDDENVDYRGYS